MTRAGHSLVVSLAILSTACGHRSPNALALCTKASRGDRVASASLTTVGAVRAYRYGPSLQPARDAFGGAKDGSPAAWCWVSLGSSWHVYAAGPSAARVDVTNVTAPGVPSGPPMAP